MTTAWVERGSGQNGRPFRVLDRVHKFDCDGTTAKGERCFGCYGNGEWSILDEPCDDDVSQRLRTYLVRCQDLVTKRYGRTRSRDMAEYAEEAEEARIGYEHAMRLWRGADRRPDAEFDDADVVRVSLHRLSKTAARAWLHGALRRARSPREEMSP